MPTPDRFSGSFNDAQTEQLLLPINPRRIKNANGHDHVPGHEVIAHLIRIFGFGNYSYELVDQPELIFETVRPESTIGTFTKGSGQRAEEIDRASNPQLWKYDVCYRATVRLTIFDEFHNLVCWYEDSSTGDASNQTRADGHDLALKSAITLAKKRAAVHLGDQFGLSLYNKGQRTAMVQKVKVAGKALLEKLWQPSGNPGAPAEDASEGVEEQRSLGIDERRGNDDTEATPEQEAQLNHSLGSRPNAEATA
jgi:hypothetical protein